MDLAVLVSLHQTAKIIIDQVSTGEFHLVGSLDKRRKAVDVVFCDKRKDRAFILCDLLTYIEEQHGRYRCKGERTGTYDLREIIFVKQRREFDHPV